MNGEISTVIDEQIEQTIEKAPWRPIRNIRLAAAIFGIFCYAGFAGLYFLSPSNPVFSLGPARFTVDALLELSFTVLALPAFGMAYFHGTRHHDEDPDFPVPDLAIDLLFVVSIAWVAIGNGIHLTAKLDEQLVSSISDAAVLGIRANFHWIRQEVGHVFPHIGWQILFSAVMLAQLKRPYLGKDLKPVIMPAGIIFGLLFAQGSIAGDCTHLGFILTAISCLSFYYLAYRSKLLPGEIPTVKFFFAAQVTFLFAIPVYWVVFHRGLL